MTDIATATAAPAELKIGDRTFRVAPLDLNRIGQFDQWMRATAMQTATAAVGMNGMPESDRQILLKHAYAVANRINTVNMWSGRNSDGDVKDAIQAEAHDLRSQIMERPEAQVRILHLLLQKHQPDLTIDELQEMLEDPVVMQRALDESGDFMQRMAPAETPGKKGGARRRRGKRRRRQSR